MPTPIDPNQMKSFVKNTLGCTCPDSVFEKQEFDSDVTIGNINNCKKLCAGERLLIYLIDIESISDLPLLITSIIAEGSKERDSRGLNRFRLVLGTDNADAVSKEAKKIFVSIDGLDDKVHLHVVTRQEINTLS